MLRRTSTSQESGPRRRDVDRAVNAVVAVKVTEAKRKFVIEVAYARGLQRSLRYKLARELSAFLDLLLARHRGGADQVQLDGASSMAEVEHLGCVSFDHFAERCSVWKGEHSTML